ncbi:MAG: hypothetical protein F8N39_10935 [Clostridiaceae bacterium]|nr:hypothetical protein [Clostridiaceae bacterium]
MERNDFMEDFSIAELNIRRLVETSCQEESNKLLKDGWYLLNCYIKDGLNIYVLGLPKFNSQLENAASYKLYEPD